ncbi:MAG: hypothetical protein M3121_00435, partial [Chloroflexota bacterium]|nr:hypothetical protein [Chloroflexota bacterium]
MSSGTREIDSASSLTPTPAADSAPERLSARERWVRLGLVAVVALSIVGGAWALAGRAGPEEVGTG